jgi:hypothetical protein
VLQEYFLQFPQQQLIQMVEMELFYINLFLYYMEEWVEEVLLLEDKVEETEETEHQEQVVVVVELPQTQV